MVEEVEEGYLSADLNSELSEPRSFQYSIVQRQKHQEGEDEGGRGGGGVPNRSEKEYTILTRKIAGGRRPSGP